MTPLTFEHDGEYCLSGIAFKVGPVTLSIRACLGPGLKIKACIEASL